MSSQAAAWRRCSWAVAVPALPPDPAVQPVIWGQYLELQNYHLNLYEIAAACSSVTIITQDACMHEQTIYQAVVSSLAESKLGSASRKAKYGAGVLTSIDLQAADSHAYAQALWRVVRHSMHMLLLSEQQQH